MSKVISNFYYGELAPNDKIIPQGYEYRALEKRINDRIEQIEKLIPEVQQKPFHELCDLQMQSLCTEREEAFTAGFSLGVRMLAEAFTYRELTVNS